MSSPRQIVDAVVRSATIELFASYGVAAAPVDLAVNAIINPQHELLGSISFTAPSLRGVLLLSAANRTLAKVAHESPESALLRDWMRELTNQLMGRIKNRLSRYQLVLQAGLPGVVDGRMFEQSAKGASFRYAFRTLTGEIFVILVGDFDLSALTFSTVQSTAEEGDVILF